MKAVVQSDTAAIKCDLPLVPGKNLLSGATELSKQIGPLSALEEDLLTVAAASYVVDLATKRGEREFFTRELSVSVPVVHYDAFTKLEEELVNILYFLSSDNWSFEFSPKAGSPEGSTVWKKGTGRTLLFSGGLDSFAAAVAELANGTDPQLVSHYTANRVIRQSPVSYTHLTLPTILRV